MRGIVSEYQVSFDNLAALGNQSERPQPVSVSEVDMVPMKEFENLKQLTSALEKEAAEVIEKKDGHIKCLMDEISFLRESQRVDMEELKLQHEL